MEAVVHQSFSDILLADSCLLFEWSGIDDEFMATEAVTDMEDLVVRLESLHDVISIENSSGCCFPE